MELKVYNWERFDRSKTWFFIFAFVILLVVILSILSSNILVWAYVFYNTKTNNTVKMIIWEKALQIWKTVLPYESLTWFVLEYHTEKKKIHNIVIIENKQTPRIYTIKDTGKNLENFVNELNEYTPILEKYEQSAMDKFIRKLKL